MKPQVSGARQQMELEPLIEPDVLLLDDLSLSDWADMFDEDMSEDSIETSGIEWGKEAEQELPAEQRIIFRNGTAEVFSPSVEPVPLRDEKERVRANISAIETAKRLLLANEYASTAEQEVIAAYSGWENVNFSDHASLLKAHFSEEEIQYLMSLPQYPYAPGEVVTGAINKILETLGFKAGNILIHGAGNGSVLRSLPKEMVQNSRVTIDATDKVNGDFQSLLFPTSEISWEEELLQESYYDMAITLAPVHPDGNKTLLGRRGSKLELPNYVASMMRSINAVRPGGFLLLMVDSFTADTMKRRIPFFFTHAPLRLLGGLRMAYNAFGNGECYDIFLFEKSQKKSFEGAEFFNNHGHLKYFIENPSCVIGEENPEEGTKTYVSPISKAEADEMISSAIDGWGCDNLYQEVEVDDETEGDCLPAIPSVKNFGMVLINGEVYQRVDSRMIKQKFTGRALERVKGMIAIRNQAGKLIRAQIAECDDVELALEQRKLNDLYDGFVKEFGYLTSAVNLRLFREDAEASILASLEYTDDEDVVHKADIFTKRTIKVRKTVTSCDTPQEAFAICLDQKNWVDISYMAQLCDLPEDEILREIVGTLVFKNPDARGVEDQWLPSDQYLSGNVLQKLNEAKAAAENFPEYAVNVKALEAVQPDLIPAEDIKVNLGVPYLNPYYISQFIYEVIGEKKVGKSPLSFPINVNSKGDSKITPRCWIGGSNPQFCNIYGTKEYDAIWLIQKLMNKSPAIATKEEIDAAGKTHRVQDRETTVVLMEKCRLIEEKFQEWIFQDPKREAAIVEVYNQNYNTNVVPKYDGSHLTFPGMSESIELKPHQKNAVYRIIRENGALIGHVVGAGKTITLLAAGMELKRLGRINKPLYLVPNNLLAQWGGEMMRLYPTANILLADPGDMRKQRRKRFLTRMATGDYDAIILGASSFGLIPTPSESVRQTIWHNAELLHRNRYPNRPFCFSESLLTPRMKEDEMQNFLANQSADFNLEELGIDYLFVDESHEFKNLYCPSNNRGGIRGIANTASAKATDLYYKTKYMSSLHGGKGGFTFATGTAIVNSITELYSLQRYFQEDLLIQKHITSLNDWLALFGKITTDWELPPEGLSEDGTGFRQVTRVSSFENVPELMQMVLQFLDTVTKDEINMATPDVVTQTVNCPASLEQKQYMQQLVERAEAIRKGKAKKTVDNMLKVTVDGRKAALDIRTIDPTLPESRNGKVRSCADSVFELSQQYQPLRGTQIIFSDISTPNQTGFSVYDALKKRLVQLGIPEDEIAFAHDFKTAKQQVSMRLKMQTGRLRVLIGSTGTIGQGANVQNRLIALHNIDVPWVPKDIEQRLGRIERPGNMHSTVFVRNYVTEGSFDAYMWQTVELKAKLISQVLRGDLSHRTIEDSDTKVLSYSEIKAIATGDTRFLQRAKLEGEIARLETLQRNFESQRVRLKQDVHKNLPQAIRYLNDIIPRIEQDVAAFEVYKGDPVLECAGLQYHLNDSLEKTAAIQALTAEMAHLKSGTVLGTYNGASIVVSEKESMFSFFSSKDYTICLQGQVAHRLDPERTIFKGASVLSICSDIIQGIPESLEDKKEKLKSNELALKSAAALLREPFDQQDTLDRLKGEYEALTASLSA